MDGSSSGSGAPASATAAASGAGDGDSGSGVGTFAGGVFMPGAASDAAGGAIGGERPPAHGHDARRAGGGAGGRGGRGAAPFASPLKLASVAVEDAEEGGEAVAINWDEVHAVHESFDRYA